VKGSATISIDQAHKVEECGNKAVNLGRAMRLGLRSQDGYVLPVTAFTQNLLRLGLAKKTAEVLKANPEDQHEGDVLRDAILQGGLSPALTSSVSSVLEPGTTYAVRSSAVGEDGATSSFAGQFDSVLNCDTPEKVAQAICTVWASLLNQRALTYAQKLGSAPAAMGVIIQRQVAARASGVLFTRDPRDAKSACMEIEYCEGLGEQLVSGQITPASGQINRGDGSFREINASETATCWTPAENSSGSVLRDMGLALEREFGCPQDIEFSVDEEGQIVLLQSRPITTSVPEEPMVSWSNANIAENFPDPVCTMLQSFVARGYGAYFRSLAIAFGVPKPRVTELSDRFDILVACHGGRLYYNLSNIHALLYAVPGGRFLVRYFNNFTGAKEVVPPTQTRPTVIREAFELAQMPFRILYQYITLGRRLKAFEAQVDAYANAAHPGDLGTKTAEDLAGLLRQFLNIRLNSWTPAALSDAAAMISYGMLGSLLSNKPDIDENELLQGLPGLASASPVEALWALSQDLKSGPAAEVIRSETPEDILDPHQNGDLKLAAQKIQNYLEKWGFRSSGELLLIRPTPQEDPLPVLRLLHAYLHSDDAGPIEKSAKQAGVRKTKTQAALRSFGPARRQLFRVVLWATQTSIGLRERARMKQALLYSRLRQVALAAGHDLVSKNVLNQADDIFFLGLDEAVDTVLGAKVPIGEISRRRHDMKDNEAWAPPDEFFLPKGQFFQAEDVSQEVADPNKIDQLTGTSACAGKTRGTAAVVLDVSDIGLIQKDQILVTRQTDPGWAAVFFLVKGLVIERGGLLSHGAIIAREYGIPAVIGVKGATKSIPNGATVEVLGDLGTVRIHDA